MWQEVVVEGTCGRKECYASVGHSKISINVSSCSLIKNLFNFAYVTFYSNENQTEQLVGVYFHNNNVANSYIVSRKVINKKPVGGIEICSKLITENLFGKESTGSTIKYKVTICEDKENMLVIHIPKQQKIYQQVNQ